MPPQALKVLLDTSAINWLTDYELEADVFFSAKDAGLIDTLVTPEAATEVRNTKNAERLARLEAVLSKFFPLTPTLIPRAGAFRSGLGRMATKTNIDRLDSLSFLPGGRDRHLAVNAAGYKCDVFLTNDAEMAHVKRVALESTLAGTQVLTPAEFIRQLPMLLGRKNERQNMTRNQTWQCPACKQELTYVKEGPHGEIVSGGSGGITMKLASDIYRCPQHGLLRVYISGAIEPYAES